MGRVFERRFRARLQRDVGLRVLVVVILGLLSAGSAEARASMSPEDYGSRAVTVTRVRIPVPVDPRGPEGVFTSLDADVYVPAGSGPFPVAQLSHAWPGTLKEFPLSGWGNRLASRGFVVIISDRRAGSASPDPGFDQLVGTQDFNSDVNGEDILRVLRWAIEQNTTAGSVLLGKVDPRRLAIGGHSLGAYFATFAAVKAKTEGPRLSALVLLDPTDERLGDHTLNSSLAVSPSVTIPTIVLGSEANQHPIMCDMSMGPDCTIVSPQQYAALTGASARFGLKVVGAVHEDVEDPNTGSVPSQPAQLRLFQRYAMAWFEFWAGRDCSVRGYLGGRDALRDQEDGAVALYDGATPSPRCRRAKRLRI